MTIDAAVVAFAVDATRAVVYLAALMVVGAGMFDVVVLRRAARFGLVDPGPIRAAARRVGGAAAAGLALGYAGRLYFQAVDSFLVAVPTGDMLHQLLFSTRAWGLGVLAQLVIAGVVLLMSAYAWRRPAAGGVAVAAAAALAAASVPLTGHAISHAGAAAVAVQAAHVFVAGAWFGTLAVLGLSIRRLTGAVDLAAVVRAFSAVALTSAALLALSGLASLFSHVATPREVLGTRYGVTLLLKIAVFAAAAGAGFVNWRLVTPFLAAPDARRRLRRTIGIELALALLAVLVTTVLTDLARPGD